MTIKPNESCDFPYSYFCNLNNGLCTIIECQRIRLLTTHPDIARTEAIIKPLII